MATITGTIKRLNSKGFGFIAAADGNEYFFHSSACSGTRFEDLREGLVIGYDVSWTSRGRLVSVIRIPD